jgi:hypothetical protein
LRQWQQNEGMPHHHASSSANNQLRVYELAQFRSFVLLAWLLDLTQKTLDIFLPKMSRFPTIKTKRAIEIMYKWKERR